MDDRISSATVRASVPAWAEDRDGGWNTKQAQAGFEYIELVVPDDLACLRFGRGACVAEFRP
jgi:hypothetical protein